MKNKKALIYTILCIIIASSISSCGVDKKCPAYSQAETIDNVLHV